MRNLEPKPVVSITSAWITIRHSSSRAMHSTWNWSMQNGRNPKCGFQMQLYQTNHLSSNAWPIVIVTPATRIRRMVWSRGPVTARSRSGSWRRVTSQLVQILNFKPTRRYYEVVAASVNLESRFLFRNSLRNLSSVDACTPWCNTLQRFNLF